MSIKLSNLVIDIPKTLEGDILLLENPRVYENYEEGVKTGPAGLAYTCLCEGLNFEKQVVKIPGATEPPFEYEGKPIHVTFGGIEGKAWQDFSNKGEIKLSVTAKSITPLVEKPHIKMNTGGKS